MKIRRMGPLAASLALLVVGAVLFAPARADAPGELQQQMQTMREEMATLQGQMLQMHQWMQQMMGRGMMGPGGYGMMGPGFGYGGMMGPGFGYGPNGSGMMGFGGVDPDDMPGYGMMGGGLGMMGGAGADADRNFVLMMQRHHRGEIAMAAAVAAETKDPEIKKLAEAIQADHEKDLQALDDWLAKHR